MVSVAMVRIIVGNTAGRITYCCWYYLLVLVLPTTAGTTYYCWYYLLLLVLPTTAGITYYCWYYLLVHPAETHPHGPNYCTTARAELLYWCILRK